MCCSAAAAISDADLSPGWNCRHASSIAESASCCGAADVSGAAVSVGDTPGITPLRVSLHADVLLLYCSQGDLLHPQAGTEGLP